MTTVQDIARNIAYCGLICTCCHLAENCGGCKSSNNNCAKLFSEQGCYQHDCCIAKGIDGCWQCDEFPCGKDMFSRSHDIRLRAFVRCAKEEGAEALAGYVLKNQQNGILYGHGKDYDNLGSEEAVLKLLRTGR